MAEDAKASRLYEHQCLNCDSWNTELTAGNTIVTCMNCETVYRMPNKEILLAAQERRATYENDDNSGAADNSRP